MAPRMGYLLLRATLAPCAERNRAVAPLRSLISLPFSFSVLLVADLFQPIDVPAVDGFLDGDVAHPGGRRGSMPVPHSGWNAHHIARADFLDRALVGRLGAGSGDGDRLVRLNRRRSEREKRCCRCNEQFHFSP